MLFRKLIIALAATFCLVPSFHAQQIPQGPGDTGLVLEVTFLKGTAPTFQNVSSSLLKKGGTWYARFGRSAGWQLPQGELPIKAVRLVPYLKNETVTVYVSVLRGQKFHDAEDEVAYYKVRENEVVTVSELEAFGVEPFVFKVLRTSTSSEFPATLNKTESVAVVGLEAVVSTLPRYKLTLHNSSAKNIIALSMAIGVQSSNRITTVPQGKYGETLIKTGGSHAFQTPLATNAVMTPGGYQPSPQPGQQIVIESLVFEDGSYEGDLKSASRILGFVVGRRDELRRILPLWNTLSSTDPNAAADEFASALRSLGYEPHEAEIKSLAKAFPTLDKNEQRISVEAAIHGVRRELLDQLEGLQRSEAGASAINEWLVSTRKLYSSWLERLNAVKVSQP
jgi:hypothetical protein